MNFIGKAIQHKTYGEGIVTNVDSKYITIAFSVGQKIFPFPKAFIDGNLITNDEDINTFMIAERSRIQQDELESMNRELETINKIKPPQKPVAKQKTSSKKVPRSNVAFKCTYCDGGKTNQRLGFNGVCSDAMIKYNIYKAKHSWCSQDDCPCNSYLHGYIKRNELDARMLDGGYVCYESQMLRNWSAFAGFYTTGENYGKPMHMNSLEVNGLAVLTTRLENKSEAERIIFAVFLIDETFEGDHRDEGQVSTRSKYRIELTSEEAKVMKFWKYHSNEKKSDVPAWASGLFRYLDDIQAAIILRDLAELKKGTKDAALSSEFFEYYCKVNGVDINGLPSLDGALTKK